MTMVVRGDQSPVIIHSHPLWLVPLPLLLAPALVEFEGSCQATRHLTDTPLHKHQGIPYTLNPAPRWSHRLVVVLLCIFVAVVGLHLQHLPRHHHSTTTRPASAPHCSLDQFHYDIITGTHKTLLNIIKISHHGQNQGGMHFTAPHPRPRGRHQGSLHTLSFAQYIPKQLLQTDADHYATSRK